MTAPCDHESPTTPIRIDCAQALVRSDHLAWRILVGPSSRNPRLIIAHARGHPVPLNFPAPANASAVALHLLPTQRIGEQTPRKITTSATAFRLGFIAFSITLSQQPRNRTTLSLTTTTIKEWSREKQETSNSERPINAQRPSPDFFKEKSKAKLETSSH